jgi:hypothetical protein
MAPSERSAGGLVSTAIIGGPRNQFGRGNQICTRTGGSLFVNNMKLGPDGDNWVLLSREEAMTLFGGATAKVMGDGGNVYKLGGARLIEGYVYAETGWRSPRVWQRNMDGWNEIAVNFCVKPA